MAWETELVGLLRVLINDIDTPYGFSDARLQTIIVAGAQFVIGDLKKGGVYLADISEPDITPDPTTADPRDESFINLIVLRSACFMDSAKAVTDAKKGFSIREFSSSLDTRGVASARLALLEKGYCKWYEDMLIAEQVGNSAVGVAIMGPIRTIYGAYASSAGYDSPNTELFSDGRR